MDKCTETYAVRIPEILKDDLDKLSTHQKKELNKKLIIEMARAVHVAKFDPNFYLNSDP